ncbi:Hypothetical predicted protein [Pelobates cultripes]|uniref:Uncharacterized protein n=1 Tax=Pelobates cultripes TaxID=61616 RepID=A0AAD1TCD6_PELCU|nr:Hypothetical predicted protein [Pelobates cultripes]
MHTLTPSNVLALSPHGKPLMRPVNGRQTVGYTRAGMWPGAHWTGAAAELPAWSGLGADCYKRVSRNPPLGNGGGDPGPPLGVFPDMSETTEEPIVGSRDSPKMEATTRSASSQEVQQAPLTSLEQIFTNFWLKLEYRMQQGAQQMPTSSRPQRHAPPDTQWQPAALGRPKTMRRWRRDRQTTHPYREAKRRTPPKANAGTTRTPFTRGATLPQPHDSPKRHLPRPQTHRIEWRLHGHPRQGPAQPQRAIG